ncbi:D-2-hydroxyacid dehydrogenase [Hanamia caeni]|uniref:D-2-hydroxyacid dehydrogenase n=1 Tax=Hanamia caeni TaxID=2294116 RepID=A0A3M9N923_9BACT|nr:D-2-hydroxyacid dehydrogenase [Hanamia caeni]RNI34246.1 D-2-hydroxyacid dehydrogenase [Hanamia caeni]
MKIVVLDAFAMNPGDLSWEQLKNLGDTDIYDRSLPEESRKRVSHAEVILTNKALVNKDIMEAAPNLKYIGVMATGYNVVDITEAHKRNIIVTNVPAYSTASVAQLTFAFILELANHTALYAQSVKNGDWVRSKDFSYHLKPIMELQNKTLGIIGFGQIGQNVAKIALAFGMRVISSHKHPERNKMEGVTFVDEKTCFKEADIVSLHCPLTQDNFEFVNKQLLATMKPKAFLVNTSRGGLVNENDLAEALNHETITGAALDVLSTEPPSANNPLLHAKNCLINPHVAWATFESRARLMDVVVNNIESFLKGKPVNVI